MFVDDVRRLLTISHRFPDEYLLVVVQASSFDLLAADRTVTIQKQQKKKETVRE
jgi:hypothetical protein